MASKLFKALRQRWRRGLYYLSWFTPALLSFSSPGEQAAIIMFSVFLGAIVDRVVLLGLPDSPPQTKKLHIAMSILLEALLASLRVAVTEIGSQTRAVLRSETPTGIVILSILILFALIGIIIMISELATIELIGPLERIRLHEIRNGLDRNKERDIRGRLKHIAFKQYRSLKLQYWTVIAFLLALLVYLITSAVGLRTDITDTVFGFGIAGSFILFLLTLLFNCLRFRKIEKEKNLTDRLRFSGQRISQDKQ